MSSYSAPVTPPPQPSREKAIGRGLAWTSRWVLRLLVLAAGLWVLGQVIRLTWSILLPVLLALLFTTVLQPVSDALHRRLRIPRSLAAATTLLSFFAALIGVGFLIAPSVAGQSGEIVEDTSAGLQQLQDWVQESEFVTAGQIDSLIQQVQDLLGTNGSTIANGVLTGLGAVGSGLVTVVLAIVLTFLFLKDGHAFLPWVGRLAGQQAGTHLTVVLGRCWSTLGGFVRTQALVSLIDAVLIGAALLIIGVPLAIPLAILTFAAGFIPIAGAFVAGGIAVLVALVSVGVNGALIMLVVIVLVQQFEGNVLSPMLQSRSMQLHPAVVLLSVALASTLFGIIGAFLAVPTAAVAAVILRSLDETVREAADEPHRGDQIEPTVAEAADDVADARAAEREQAEQAQDAAPETTNDGGADGDSGRSAPPADR